MAARPTQRGWDWKPPASRLEPEGGIVVDDYSRTNVAEHLRLGDVTDRVQLTPVAIHEAMCFIDTEYRGRPTIAGSRPDPDRRLLAAGNRHGRPERRRGGQELSAISRSIAPQFRPMKATLSGRDEKMIMKLIVDADAASVVGAHILGPEAGEMAQLLGVAVKAGCTKDDFRPHHGRASDACRRAGDDVFADLPRERRREVD